VPQGDITFRCLPNYHHPAIFPIITKYGIIGQQNGDAVLSPYFKLNFLTGGAAVVNASVSTHKQIVKYVISGGFWWH
jgi:hypothetical protein